MPKIFVSYSRADKRKVGQIVDQLRSDYGHENVFWDEDFRGGDLWWDKLLGEIGSCHIFVYMMSSRSIGAPYCQAELEEAERLHKHILPVRLRRGTAVPDVLARLHYVELTGRISSKSLVGLRRSINELANKPASTQPPLRPDPVRKPDVPHAEPRSLTDILIEYSTQIMLGVLITVLGGAILWQMQRPSDPVPASQPPVATATRPSDTPEATQDFLSEAVARGSAFTGGNADWEQQYPNGLQFIFDDGVRMVLVPAGCFMMGSTDYDDEQPQHQQCFSAPFWIDRTEVTQGDFARLGGVQAEQSRFPGADRPVERITWFEARDFCALRGARLPTEAEWEYAARGPDSLTYPWGNAWNEDNAVWDGNSGGQTAPVGSRPAGRSWVGTDDMSGNVWEWTSSLYEPYPYAPGDGREADTGTSTGVLRVVRGGSWDYGITGYLRAAYRYWGFPVGRLNDLGFRCARSEGATQIINTPTSTPTPTATPDVVLAARAFTGGNADWEQQYPNGLQFIFDDGVRMVLVPAGCFMMGSTDYDDEQPQHQQCFSAPFWIDRTEVTQGDFARLGGVQAERSWFSGADRPVENITWFEARDFCALRGARLPTEAEWEYAARGPDGLAYPWGNAFDEDNAVWNRGIGEGTAPVGSRPAGRSWVGADDMSGNVWEWTSSLYEPYPYAAGDGREADTGTSTDVVRVVRGGSWHDGLSDFLRAANRNWSLPELRDGNIGFRCARSS